MLLKHAKTRRVLAIAAKEMRHVTRDPRSLYLALVMPVLLLILFGYGVSFDMDHLPVAVLDEDQTSTSRHLIERFFGSGEFERANAQISHASQAMDSFAEGRSVAVLVVPHGLSQAVARGEMAHVQLLVDGVENNTATQVMGKGDAVVRVASAGNALSDRAPFDVRATYWFNPSARSALFLVPGLVAYVLAIVCVLLTALTIAREYERRSIQQLFVTPISVVEIMVGKLIPYFGLGVVVTLLVLTAGAWIFSVPIRGSLLALALVSTLFLLGMLGQGLTISIVAKNQMVATQMATMTSMLPSLLLSGFIFPVENMPTPLRVISNVVPARYFIHALRSILLRGAATGDIWQDALAIAAFVVVMFALGVRKFKRELA